MGVAYLQEFPIVDGDTSTTNNDAIVAALDLRRRARRPYEPHDSMTG